MFIADAKFETVEGETTPDQVIPPAEQWKILGYTGESGLGVIARINTREGLDEVFAKIHADTGDESFSTKSLDHYLQANLRTMENKRYSADAQGDVDDEVRFPFSFELTVRRVRYAH